MNISNETVKCLVGIINESVYRKGYELVEFFNQFGFQHTYPDSVYVSGSRANYTRDVILDLNGSTKLDQVIQTAIHPRNYLGTQVNVTDVVESLNEYLNYDGYEIIRDGSIYSIKYKNENQGRIIKNLIFAADGPKPEIVLVDTLQYEIDVVSNSEYVLIFDGTISGDGLSWNQMVNWWSTKYEVTSNKHVLFYQRLYRSLDSNAERLFFQTYYEFFNHYLFADVPILIPQVYLHYDPYTLSQLNGVGRIPRQRMDFLLLLPEHQRIVLEIDGRQHYTDDFTQQPSPSKYAEMVAEDRRLRLTGYEVYRFGGYELMGNNHEQLLQTKTAIKNFFEKLFEKHNLVLTHLT